MVSACKHMHTCVHTHIRTIARDALKKQVFKHDNKELWNKQKVVEIDVQINRDSDLPQSLNPNET